MKKSETDQNIVTPEFEQLRRILKAAKQIEKMERISRPDEVKELG